MKFTAPVGKQVRVGRRKVADFKDGTYETDDKAEIEALGKALNVTKVAAKQSKPKAEEPDSE